MILSKKTIGPINISLFPYYSKIGFRGGKVTRRNDYNIAQLNEDKQVANGPKLW